VRNYFGSFVISILCFGTALCFAQEERVAGASLIGEASELESVLLDVVANPLTQSEVDLFVSDADAVLGWAELNSDLWLSAERSENPVTLIKSFQVWGEVEIRFSEFMAVVSKLMFLEEVGAEEVDVLGMRQELENMRGFIESGQVPAEAIAQVSQMVVDLEKMLYLMESVVPSCRPVFEKNLEIVGPFLERLQTIED
tara:strand:+ start:88 stop:681 length:594 start_codon:yes stop_codon:yes gene_type:complete